MNILLVDFPPVQTGRSRMSPPQTPLPLPSSPPSHCPDLPSLPLVLISPLPSPRITSPNLSPQHCPTVTDQPKMLKMGDYFLPAKWGLSHEKWELGIFFTKKLKDKISCTVCLNEKICAKKNAKERWKQACGQFRLLSPLYAPHSLTWTKWIHIRFVFFFF